MQREIVQLNCDIHNDCGFYFKGSRPLTNLDGLSHTPAVDKTALQMAPEQGLVSNDAPSGKPDETTTTELGASTAHSNSQVINDNQMMNIPNDFEIMEVIRRWDLIYDGNSSYVEFIERLEELAECYNFPRNRLLFPLLEILRGRALRWYRIKRHEIHSWEEFKKEAIRFFLPKRYLAYLEETIHNRRQQPNESAKDFIIDLQTLIRQHPELGKLDNTDRIYDKLRSEYKLYVRRSDFNSLDELMDIADEYEAIRREEKKPANKFLGTLSAHESYSRATHCWRCKIRGHTRQQCRNPMHVFCSRCGTDGVMSRDCRCPVPMAEEGQHDPRHFLLARINGVKVRALIDTGSTCSYMGRQFQNKLEAANVSAISRKSSVELANGSKVSIRSQYQVSIEANGRSTPLTVSLLPNLNVPVILGLDFLKSRQTKLYIDGIELISSEPDISRQVLAPINSIEVRNNQKSPAVKFRKDQKIRQKLMATTKMMSPKLRRSPHRRPVHTITVPNNHQSNKLSQGKVEYVAELRPSYASYVKSCQLNNIAYFRSYHDLSFSFGLNLPLYGHKSSWDNKSWRGGGKENKKKHSHRCFFPQSRGGM